MIDPTVLSVVENRVTQDLEDRRRVFSHEVAQIWERMNVRGVLHSTMTATQTLEAIGTEFRVRTSLIWQAFARAFDAKRIMLSETMAVEVKQHIIDLLDRHSADLPERHKMATQLMRRPLAPIEEPRIAALERIFTEIDFAVLKHSAPTESTPGVVNIYQSYGIVQTGAGTSASFTIRIGGPERREIEEALEAIEQALGQAASLGSVERDQALELVSDVKNELRREEPNGLRIRGALQGLATTIQTVAAAPQAYQLLKGAAALLGLQLP